MFLKKFEIIIQYDPSQRELYKNEDPACIYPLWPSKVGIHKKGRNFPAMVARKYFENKGYKVLNQYYLMRCHRKRETNEGFKFLCGIFGEDKLRHVISNARPLIGGDPDLFVYKEDCSDCFFVEVKENDKITRNQSILIPIIERYLCPVKIVRVVATHKVA
jgi:hypothetical protein